MVQRAVVLLIASASAVLLSSCDGHNPLEPRALGRWEARVTAAAFALGWTAEGHKAETVLRFLSRTP